MGVELLVVPVPGWSIHIDLHLALVDQERALVDAERLPYDFLVRLRDMGFDLIEADATEAWGLNLLCLRPGRVLMVRWPVSSFARISPRSPSRRSRRLSVASRPWSRADRPNGLEQTSAIACDHITTIPAARLGPQIGQLLDTQEPTLTEAIHAAFDLDSI